MPRRKNPNALLYEATTKLSKSDFDNLLALAQNHGTKRSLILREAILTYLQTSDNPPTQAAS